MTEVVEMRLKSGRILFYRNHNPRQHPRYGFWVDADGIVWFAGKSYEEITVHKSMLCHPDEAVKDD